MTSVPSNLDSVSNRPDFQDSEIVIGLVGAVGTELKRVVDILTQRLKHFQYGIHTIKISSDVIGRYVGESGIAPKNEYDRIKQAMDAGNRACERNHGILALGAISEIAAQREKDSTNSGKPLSRRASIIDSLKHKAEVKELRHVYPQAWGLAANSRILSRK